MHQTSRIRCEPIQPIDMQVQVLAYRGDPFCGERSTPWRPGSGRDALLRGAIEEVQALVVEGDPHLVIDAGGKLR